jgi:hypothetical protein
MIEILVILNVELVLLLSIATMVAYRSHGDVLTGPYIKKRNTPLVISHKKRQMGTRGIHRSGKSRDDHDCGTAARAPGTEIENIILASINSIIQKNSPDELPKTPSMPTLARTTFPESWDFSSNWNDNVPFESRRERSSHDVI